MELAASITPTNKPNALYKARNFEAIARRLVNVPRRCEHTAVIRTTFLINLHSPIFEIQSPSARFLTLFVEHLHASQDASRTSEIAQNAISKSEHVWHITGSKYPNRDRTTGVALCSLRAMRMRICVCVVRELQGRDG